MIVSAMRVGQCVLPLLICACSGSTGAGKLDAGFAAAGTPGGGAARFGTSGRAGGRAIDTSMSGSGGHAPIASGMDAGAMPDGAVAVAPRSKRQACIAYVKAFCKRQFECGVNALDCSSEDLGLCPDLLFSAGSTRTIDGTFECAERWRVLPCVDVQRGAAPSCVMPGSACDAAQCFEERQDGASCAEPFTRCEDGTECQRGTCTALDSRGLFEQACKL